MTSSKPLIDHLAIVPQESAGQATILIEANKPGYQVSPLLWGIFFEDINLSADGGIYPELVRNRSFEDGDTPENWKFTSTAGTNVATISAPSYSGRPANPPLNPFNRRSLQVRLDGAFTLENEGYWGMNMVQGEGYTLKFAARATDGFTGPIVARIISSGGQELASGAVKEIATGNAWKEFT